MAPGSAVGGFLLYILSRIFLSFREKTLLKTENVRRRGILLKRQALGVLFEIAAPIHFFLKIFMNNKNSFMCNSVLSYPSHVIYVQSKYILIWLIYGMTSRAIDGTRKQPSLSDAFCDFSELPATCWGNALVSFSVVCFFSWVRNFACTNYKLCVLLRFPRTPLFAKPFTFYISTYDKWNLFSECIAHMRGKGKIRFFNIYLIKY